MSIEYADVPSSTEVPDEAPDIPSDTRRIDLSLTEEGILRLQAKARQAGCSTDRLIRQGIDWMFKNADRVVEQAIELVMEPNPYAPSRDDKKTYQTEIQPIRKVYLDEAVERINKAISRGEANSRGPSSSKQVVRQIDVLRTAAKHMIVDVSAEEIQTVDPLEEESGYQHYDKLPGRERGGKQLRFDITKDAKKKLAERADEKPQKTSELAREAVEMMMSWIEEDPEEAFEYIKEDSELYQPPHTGGEQYAYQFYMGIIDKKRIKRARWILQEGPAAEDGTYSGRVSQREIMQAAARWAIEGYVKSELDGLVTEVV